MLQTIEIDFDIHKAIENERRGFEEPPRVALRRLLKLPDPPVNEAPAAGEGRAWTEGSVELPHGTEARMEYQRGAQRFEGRFLDGRLVVDGREFDSLSSAASGLARTKDGSAPSLNGWNYWEVRLPQEDRWIPVKLLRSRGKRSTL